MKQDRAPVLAQLDQVLASDLAEEVRRTAQRLRDRLAQPVRVVVTGRAGTGKTTLCRLLATGPLSDLSLTEQPVSPGATTGWPPNADMILWCGQQFDTADMTLWTSVPDRLKDHSFLILTKADFLAAQGGLHDGLAALRDCVDAFHGILPLATLQALAARPPQGPSDPAAFRFSGGAAVETAILQDIRAGQREVEDSAVLFLRRHPPHPFAPRPTIPVRPPSRAIGSGPWIDLHHFLGRAAASLGPVIASLGAEARVAAVLDYCRATSGALADRLSPDHIAAAPDLCEDIMTLADMIELTAIEGTARAASDALDLLLQIRRDVAACAIS